MKMMEARTILAAWLVGVVWCSAQTNNVAQQSEPPIEGDRGREWFVMGGGKYDSITGPTASVCLCWPIDHPHRTMCSHDFWILQAEAGRGGGKLQFGFGAWYMAGGAAKLSLLRTWGDPGEVEAEQTYAGVECQGILLLVNATVGLYTHLHGGDGDETLLTWSAGIGF